MLRIERPITKRVSRKVYHLGAARLAPRQARLLESQNHESSIPVVGDSPVAVSMTTHGARINSVHLALESIAAGDSRPSRLILWLDDPKAFENLPPAIKRLQARGLEVRLTANYGPHTKYWPLVSGEAGMPEHAFVATADDDVVLPRFWLRRLLKHANAAELTCYRAHVVGFSDAGELLPYNTWRECWTSAPSYANLPTGVSGVLYPPRMQAALRNFGTAFTQLAPKADDVWLHYVSVEAGLPTRQVHGLPLEFPLTPDSQEDGLYLSNVQQSRNDIQIANTYGHTTIRRIKDALSEANA
ncbi:hypothetical protein QQX09_06120 [Demequina sp. SYSU T00192]|uniref:Glycosyltransferase n=1 Tax=Demequina litoralis TaxID=3051660 RepID=A0ABT8G8F8_9MICO|nr:hypothetical protein [Demequina sp. SYSU T00192]MDN4475427.1 hypothetical protein [Demequina sp. SYSU T00192]